MNDIKKVVIDTISESCNIKEQFELNDSLITLGIDSICLVQLVLDLEDKFSICFDEIDLNTKNLRTVKDLVNLVSKYSLLKE